MLRRFQVALLIVLTSVASLVVSTSHAATVPTAGLLLGLDASQNIGTGAGNVVNSWGTVNGNTQVISAPLTFGTPTLITNFQTPNGSHAAVAFDGSSGIGLNIGNALNQQNLSIFVVGSLTPAGSNHFSDEFISNFTGGGWADGISDSGFSTPNSPKFYTTAVDTLSNTATPVTLTPGTGKNNAYLLIDTITNGGTNNKSITALNGAYLVNQQSVTDTAPVIPYGGVEYPALGYLSYNAGVQNLTGDIAEILVYDNSNPNFNAAAVEAFLTNEFFTSPEPSSVISGLTMFAMAAIGLAIKRRRGRMLRHAKAAMLVGVVAASTVLASQANAAPIPAAAQNGLLMSINANSGVTTASPGGPVNSWKDETSGTQLFTSAFGDPTTTTITTPNGSHAAINFNGASGIVLNNGATLGVPHVSVFVVGNLTQSQFSKIFIADIGSNGWASGLSDDSGTPDVTKWYNGNGGAPPSLENTTGETMSLNTVYQISTSTSGAGSTASLFDGTNTQSNSSTNTSITYGSLETTIGNLQGGPGNQNLFGNIAEILVYDNSAPGYSLAAVNAYLNAEFFSSPEPSSVISGLTMFSMAAIGLLIKRRRRAAAK